MIQPPQKASEKYKQFREAVLTSQARQILDAPRTDQLSTDTVEFCRYPLQRMPQEEAIQRLLRRCLERQSGRIYFINANSIVTSHQDLKFARALSRADLLLPDGSGVLWGSRLFGTPIKFNLNGTDLIPALCQAGASEGLSVYLLGAKPGVAEDAAKNLKQANPQLKIAGTQHGYFDADQIDVVLHNIKRAQPHLLLVAMGCPRQEVWIDKFADQLPGINCAAVGGLFDFMAQRVPRAPYAIRYLGLEWLWRMAMEPRRLWRRYILGNIVFIKLVFQYLKQQPRC